MNLGTVTLPSEPPGKPQVALVVKNLPADARDIKRHRFNPWGGTIPWKRAWQPSSILAWRIPWTEEPGGLQFTGWHRVRHN